MNLILFWRSTRGTRHLALSTPLLAGLAVCVVAVMAGSFGLGFGMARSEGLAPVKGRMDVVSHASAAATASVAQARAQDRIEALAIRLGDLNAHVIRLNALGARLVTMANLDNGEFDFSSDPAIGGPDEPLVGRAGVTDLTGDIDDLGARLDRQRRQLTLLTSLLVQRKLAEDSRPSGWPVKVGYVSSYFGRRIDPFTGQPRYHRGIDFAAKTGAEITAVANGVVTWVGYRQGYGQMVEVTHGNGYVTRYAHNARNMVSLGEQVEQGKTIALMGATGRATGANLHFEVWQNGRPVDPRRFLGRADALALRVPPRTRHATAS